MARAKNSDSVILLGDAEEARKLLPMARAQFAQRDKGKGATFGAELRVGGARVRLERNGINRRIVIEADGIAGLLCHNEADVEVPNTICLAKMRRSIWKASVITPGEYRVNYGDRGWTNGTKAVSWSNLRAEHQHRVFFRGLEVLWRPPFDGALYSDEGADYVQPWIMGCAVVGNRIVLLAYVYADGDADTPQPQRLDVLSFRPVRGEAVYTSADSEIHHSITLPATEYKSSRNMGFSNGNAYRYGACQGFSISPLGRTMIFFHDTGVHRFDAEPSQGGISVGHQAIDHPGEFAASGSFHHEAMWDGGYDGDGLEWTSRSGEQTESQSISGAWYVGAKWQADGGAESFEWITFTVDFSKAIYLSTERSVTREYATDRAGTMDIEEISVVYTASIQENIGYSGALSLDLMDKNHSASVSSTYSQTTYEVGPPFFDPPVVEYSSDSIVETRTGKVLMPVLDAQYDAFVAYDFDVSISDSVQSAEESSEVVSGERVYVNGDILFEGSDNNLPSGRTTSFNMGLPGTSLFFPAISATTDLAAASPPAIGNGWVTTEDTVGSDLRVRNAVYQGEIDPFKHHWLADYWFIDEFLMGAIRKEIFFSVVIDGTAVNYITENPDLSRVFPSSVNVTERLDPIVPF